MKQMNYFILCSLIASSAFAQNQNNNTNTPGDERRQNGANYATQCSPKIELNKKAREANSAVAIPLNQCDSHAVVALALGDTIDSTPKRVTTLDGAITCLRDGAYTVDFGNCSTMVLHYNAVLVAEKGMITTQTVMINEANKKDAKVVAAETAKGNGHNAAIDATIARNELNAKLFTRQAKIYKAAIGTLSSNLTFWEVFGGKKNLIKKCDDKKMKALSESVETNLGFKNFKMSECVKALTSISGSGYVFMNNPAKSQFLNALATFKQKYDTAKQQALNNEFVGDKLKDMVAKDLASDNLDKCMTAEASEDPECVAAAEKVRTNPGTFRGNTIDFGGAGSNTDFKFGSETDTIGDLNDPTVTDNEEEKVQDIASPFEKAAKDATGILNPAGKAEVTAGQQPGAPGGGGAGGGGGGGSASLGDDLAGVDGDGDQNSDIKSSKVSGKYNKAKGVGFSAIGKAGGADDVNPFKSMFDAEGSSEGGVEDGDVVADVGAADSELFIRIGKKYQEVQDKRLNKNQPE